MSICVTPPPNGKPKVHDLHTLEIGWETSRNGKVFVDGGIGDGNGIIDSTLT